MYTKDSPSFFAKLLRLPSMSLWLAFSYENLLFRNSLDSKGYVDESEPTLPSTSSFTHAAPSVFVDNRNVMWNNFGLDLLDVNREEG